jgi:hypothetical protein
MTTPTVPVPYALQHLIESNNQLLRQYQAELTNKVVEANLQMMKILGLNPDEGWRLDADTMSYTKVEADAPSIGE